MGLFSSIVSFIKSIVASVVSAIADIFGGGPTGVFIATLALLVINFVAISPGAFTQMLNTPWVFLKSHTILSAIVVSALVQTVSLLVPSLGRALAYAAGLLSFLIVGFDLASWYTSGRVWDSLRIWNALMPGTFGLTASQISLLFTFVSASLTVIAATMILSGSSSATLEAWLDGFFVVPEYVAAATDVVVEAAISATSQLWVPLMVLAGFYFFGRSSPPINLTAGGQSGTRSS